MVTWWAWACRRDADACKRRFYYRLRRPLNIQSQIISQMYRALAVAVADWQYACTSHEAASTRMPPGVNTRPLDVSLPFLHAPLPCSILVALGVPGTSTTYGTPYTSGTQRDMWGIPWRRGTLDDPRPACSPQERPQSRRRAPERGAQVQRGVSVMNHPPRSMPAPRRTTLVAFLVLLLAVLTLTVFMVLPYV